MARKSLKLDLYDQLKAKDADILVFKKLVEDYCWYADQFAAMQEDIKVRGRMIDAVSATGNIYTKENPAVTDALRYHQQMLKILDKLGIDPDTVAVPQIVEDDDDL